MTSDAPDWFNRQETQISFGRTATYEDASFTAAESPVTLDANTDLERNGHDGYIICDGTGDILFEVSDNGTDFGGQHTLKKNEIFSLTGLDIDSIKITHSGTDSAYRVMVI